MDGKNAVKAKEKSPKRVQAGRMNRQKYQGITADGRKRLQASIRMYKPWEQTTGPRTAIGKKQSAQNGCGTRRGDHGGRAMRREMAAVAQLIGRMQDIRRSVLGTD